MENTQMADRQNSAAPLGRARRADEIYSADPGIATLDDGRTSSTVGVTPVELARAFMSGAIIHIGPKDGSCFYTFKDFLCDKRLHRLLHAVRDIEPMAYVGGAVLGRHWLTCIDQRRYADDDYKSTVAEIPLAVIRGEQTDRVLTTVAFPSGSRESLLLDGLGKFDPPKIFRDEACILAG
jgi:hypothetical protein